MCFHKAMIYVMLCLLIFVTIGCGKKEVIEIPVLVVIDTIPERIKRDIFDYEIQNHISIRNNKKNKDVLKSTFKLIEERNEYVLEEKISEDKLVEALDIFRNIGFAPVYREAKENELILTIGEWTSVVCLMKRDEYKEVKEKNINDIEIIKKWYKIKFQNKVGWIPYEYLLFQSFKETDAVVINDFHLCNIPDMTSQKGVWGRECKRGITVQLTGFEYIERKYKGLRYQMKIPNSDIIGWGLGIFVVADAHLGVIISDEVILYSAPMDIKQNAIDKDKVKYAKFEVVPILDLLDNDWYKVVKNDKNVIYYIKKGSAKISSKEVDITFSSWIREDYIAAKSILDFVSEAREDSDTIKVLSDYQNKEGKGNISFNSFIFLIIKELEKRYDNIEEIIKKYQDSIFSGFGPYSLKDFMDDIYTSIEFLKNIQASSIDLS